MRVKIENFKSVGSAELELAPLTILVGPPAGGKSNILDAIALAGYFGRCLSGVYPRRRYEPLTALIRATGKRGVLTYGSASKRSAVALGHLLVEVYRGAGRPVVLVNRVELGPLGRACKVQELKKAVDRPIETRLYGYDRYGLSSPTCSAFACGFALRAQGKPAKVSEPIGVLSELGWNVAALADAVRGVVKELNGVIREASGLELRVLQSGAIALFDGGREVAHQLVADSIYRSLYYLAAAKTSADYASRYGLERSYVAMFEGLRAPPLLYSLLVKYLAYASNSVYVVVETHDPLLVSTLWDRVRETKTYYVARGEGGLTQAWEVDVGKLAKEGLTAEDLLYMLPREVVGKYTA